jgi:hypothetical protein
LLAPTRRPPEVPIQESKEGLANTEATTFF